LLDHADPVLLVLQQLERDRIRVEGLYRLYRRRSCTSVSFVANSQLLGPQPPGLPRLDSGESGAVGGLDFKRLLEDHPFVEETASRRSSALGYLVVLLGVAGFVLGCFLPYTTVPSVGVQGPVTSVPAYSYYRLVTYIPGGGTTHYVGELLFLFGGAATLAWVALAGLRQGQHEHRRTPSILVAVTVAWSLSWIGVLVSGWRFFDYEVGFWLMVVGIGVVIAGTIVVWVSARHTAHEPDSAGGPEPPRVAVN
jgi:hypothetical protein